jgi:hypothetical protein
MTCNNLKFNRLIEIAIFLVFAPLLAVRPSAAGENSLLRLKNGLEIRLHEPGDVAAMTERDTEGRLVLKLEDGTSYVLVEDVSDAQIANKGDGSFHPMETAWVVEALDAIDVPGTVVRMSVDVYILPLPRSGMLASSACGRNVLLTPGVREIARSAVACTVTHELGHVFQHCFAPMEEGSRWSEYLAIRGLKDASVYGEDAPRMNRPSEIFAEDFRWLFGGNEARASGLIENPDLALPGDVDGLADFFAALVTPVDVATAVPPGPFTLSLANYPNPFNPSTTIHVAFAGAPPAGGAEVDVSIYRVDGSLVRNLYRGSAPDRDLRVPWDGRDASGRAAASGVYLYAVRAAGERAVGKMILVR